MKKTELTKRALAGLIYVLILLAAFYYYSRFPWLLRIVFLIFYFLSAKEITGLFSLNKKLFYPLAHGMAILTMILFFPLGHYKMIFLAWIAYLIFMHLSILFKTPKQATRYFLGFWYIFIPFIMTVFTAFYVSPLYIFIVLWMYDTFAYLTGSLMGKRRLAPRISPGKTWEGLIGGIIFSLLVLYIIHAIPGHNGTYYITRPSLVSDHWVQTKTLLRSLPLTEMLGLVFWIILWGTIGDLFESYWKRRAGVKDSGQIMPGHGGILDRLDSFMMVQIAMFFVSIVVTIAYFRAG